MDFVLSRPSWAQSLSLLSVTFECDLGGTGLLKCKVSVSVGRCTDFDASLSIFTSYLKNKLVILILCSKV